MSSEASAALIDAGPLSKRYGRQRALDDVSLQVYPGEVVGLIGPNGAGKSTLLKCLLGMTRCSGDLQVLGQSPRANRSKMLESLSYVADVASIPEWMSVRRLLGFVEGVHPCFDRSRALRFLARTTVTERHRVSALSKGMKTQLHLALLLGSEARLLVLDEPTLGLDVLFRTEFYDTLINEYLTPQRAILLTTHQVEEIEAYLTRVVFIDRGQIALDMPMAAIPERYTKVTIDAQSADAVSAAQRLDPLYVRQLDTRTIMIFRDVPAQELQSLGKVEVPGLTDLFVAVVRGSQQVSAGE